MIERLWPDRFLVSITEPPPAWNVKMRRNAVVSAEGSQVLITEPRALAILQRECQGRVKSTMQAALMPDQIDVTFQDGALSVRGVAV